MRLHLINSYSSSFDSLLSFQNPSFSGFL